VHKQLSNSSRHEVDKIEEDEEAAGEERKEDSKCEAKA